MAKSTDFEFVLAPNTAYWFVFPEQTWLDWYKILKTAFGKEGFHVVMSQAKEGVLLGDGRQVKAVFLVLKVGPLPILTSAEAMGAPNLWNGETPEDLGVFTQDDDDHWTINVVQAWAEPKAEAVKEWAEAVASNVEEFGEEAASRAREIAQTVQTGWNKIVFGALGLGVALWLITRN